MTDNRTRFIRDSIDNLTKLGSNTNFQYQFTVNSEDTSEPPIWTIYGELKSKQDSSIYHGGIIKIKIILPAAFPFELPAVYCLTKVFHPNVGKDGLVCFSMLVNESFYDSEEGLANLCIGITNLLDEPELQYPENPEAAVLYASNLGGYTVCASQTYASNTA